VPDWWVTAFNIAYGIGQLPAGWLADRFGPRLLITVVNLRGGTGRFFLSALPKPSSHGLFYGRDGVP
jgi:MFS family permease